MFTKLQLVQASYDSRMKRETRWLSVIASQKQTSTPLENIARVLSAKLQQEWQRSVAKHCKIVGLPTTRNDRVPRARNVGQAFIKESTRLQKCITTTMKLLQESDVTSLKFDNRVKSITITSMTAVRTAGALDVLDSHRSSQVVRSRLVKLYGKPGARFAKEWFTMRDELVCSHCDELDGVVVNAYNGVFSSDQFGDVEGPPLHPNCRCEILVSKRYTKKRKRK